MSKGKNKKEKKISSLLVSPLNPLNPHRHLPIQFLLLRLTRYHPQHTLDLRRCPESERGPGHEACAEEGADSGGEGAVGAVSLVFFPSDAR